MTDEAYIALTMLAIFSPFVCVLFIAILRMVFSNIVNFFLRTGGMFVYVSKLSIQFKTELYMLFVFCAYFILLPIASYSLNMLMRYILANILKSL